RGQRRTDGAGAGNAADDGGADHLHFAVRSGVDARNGGPVRRSGLADGAAWGGSRRRTWNLVRGRLRFDRPRPGVGLSARDPTALKRRRTGSPSHLAHGPQSPASTCRSPPSAGSRGYYFSTALLPRLVERARAAADRGADER